MKHLSTYKIFESNENEYPIDIESRVNDILADVIDDGFMVENNPEYTYNKKDHIYSVFIFKDEIDEEGNYESSIRFSYLEVEDSVNELISQLSDVYPKSTIYINPDEGDDFKLDTIDDDDYESVEEIKEVRITFTK